MLRFIGLMAIITGAYTFSPTWVKTEAQQIAGKYLPSGLTNTYSRSDNEVVQAIRDRELQQLNRMDAAQRQYDRRLDCLAKRERVAGMLAANQFEYEMPANTCG